MTPPIISGIVLYDVIGDPVESDGILLIPALLDFCEDSESQAEFPLSKYKPDRLPSPALFDSPGLDDSQFLSYWLRARIPSAYGYAPLGGWDELRDGLLNYGFIAVFQVSSAAYLTGTPFVLSEGWEGPALTFRASENDQPLKARIATAFWDIALQDVFNLSNFEDVLYDQSEGYGWKVGYSRSRFYTCDLNDPDADGRWHDPHTGWYPAPMFLCPDCDGTGIEYEFPYTEDCGLCGGSGVVTW